MNDMLVQQITDLIVAQLNNESAAEPGVLMPVGISARHVHLSRQDVETLFGPGYQLTNKKTLMGGQFACEEQVTIVGTKLRAIENVRILGPERKFSQVEISKTDAIKLAVNPPVRDSGDLKGSEAIALVGPKGAVFLAEGCIIAKRHVHMTPEDAQNFGVRDKETISVLLESERGGVLNDLLVRVDPSFTLELHVDTDEANSLGVKPGDSARMIRL